MTTPPDEFGEDTEPIPDDLNTEEPEVETADEYGYTEPAVVPAPPDDPDQNPGYVEGAHT